MLTRKLYASLGILCVFMAAGELPHSSGSVAAATEEGLAGKVLAFDGITPTPGIEVVLTSVGTGEQYRSNASDASGDYAIKAVPDGDYAITVVKGEWSYELPNTVTVAGGLLRSLTLILPREAPVSVTARPPVAGKSGGFKKGLAISGGLAGLILAAVLLSDSDDDDEDDKDRDVSPSGP